MCPSGDQFCAEYRAVYDAMTNPPDADIAAQQDIIVRALVAGSVWAKLDVFYLFAQQSNADGEALINWINPGTHDATLVNAPLFTSLEGFTGDGASACINTNYNPTIDAIHLSKNSTSICAYSRSNIGAAQKTIIGGSSGANDITQCIAKWTGGDMYGNINQTSSATPNVILADTLGMIIWNRSGAADKEFYQNKILKTSTNADNSNILTNKNIYIFCFNDGGVLKQFHNGQLSMISLGSSFNIDDVDNMTDAVQAYMTSNGKQV